ncbi:MAG: hypothetical protein ABSH46_07380 [Bryobacteraceae bacterium]|jgi:hypothetical protein
MEKVLLQTRALLLIVASATALPGQTDAREIIRRAAAADESNWKVARNYTFSEREKLRYLDSQGRVKSQEVSIDDVMLLDGSPYRRLVARDDRPLPAAEEKREQEKLARSLTERRDQTAAQRVQRRSDYDLRPDWQREAWRELPNAFDFRLAMEEVWDGRTLYVIEATPHQGYQPLSRTAKMFPHLRCKLWVDKQAYQLVKGEVEVVDTIAVGLFLVRVAKGSHAAFEQTRVNDEVWLPSQMRAFVSARLGLLKVLRIEQELSYSKCRESQGDSPIVSEMRAR